MNKIKFLLVAMMIAMCAFSISCSADDPTTEEQFLERVKGKSGSYAGGMSSMGASDTDVTFSGDGKTMNQYFYWAAAGGDSSTDYELYQTIDTLTAIYGTSDDKHSFKVAVNAAGTEIVQYTGSVDADTGEWTAADSGTSYTYEIK